MFANEAFETEIGSGVYVSIKVLDSDAESYLDLTDRFISMTFEDEDNKADKLSIVLDNRNLTLLDDSRLSKGRRWEVSWGYQSMMTPPVECIVRKIKGFSILTIDALAKSVSMDKESKRRTWENTLDSDIALSIAREENYDDSMIHIDETKTVHSHVHQMESNAKFLARRAKKNGFVFYVDHTGFHFHRRRLASVPIRSYSWGFETEDSLPGGDIIGEPNFEVEHTRRKPGLIVVKGRDDKSGESFEVKGSNEQTDRDSLGESQEVANPDTVKAGSIHEQLANSEVVYDAAKTEAEAKEVADSIYFQRSTDRAKLSFAAVGDPRMRAKEIISFWCHSLYVSGSYYVEKIKTSIGHDFIQEIQAIRDASQRIPHEIPVPDVALPLPIIEADETESYEILAEQGWTERIDTEASVNKKKTVNSETASIEPIGEELEDGTWEEAYEYHFDSTTIGTGSISYDQKTKVTVRKTNLDGSATMEY